MQSKKRWARSVPAGGWDGWTHRACRRRGSGCSWPTSRSWCWRPGRATRAGHRRGTRGPALQAPPLMQTRARGSRRGRRPARGGRARAWRRRKRPSGPPWPDDRSRIGGGVAEGGKPNGDRPADCSLCFLAPACNGVGACVCESQASAPGVWFYSGGRVTSPVIMARARVDHGLNSAGSWGRWAAGRATSDVLDEGR